MNKSYLILKIDERNLEMNFKLAGLCVWSHGWLSLPSETQVKLVVGSITEPNSKRAGIDTSKANTTNEFSRPEHNLHFTEKKRGLSV